MSLAALRVSLLALCCLTNVNATSHASARATHVLRSVERRASDEGDARRAEELYRRGEGLARSGDTRGALEALKEALKLYLRLCSEAKPTGETPDAMARFRAAMAQRLGRAPESVELYRRLGGVDAATDFERGQLEALRAHALGFVESDVSRAIFLVRETDERIVLNQKPEPGFPEAARRQNVSGAVRLRAVFAADGQVKYILVLKGLPGGLTEKCVEAASKIKFTPAVKGGRPVSQFAVLEYYFNIY